MTLPTQPPPPGVAARLRTVLHGSRAVLVMTATRLWQLVSGPVTIIFIAAYFTPDVQGLFYAIGRVLAVQGLFDLGLTGVMISLSVREWGPALDDGDVAARRRLGELVRRSQRWFRRLAIGFALLVTPLGLWFLQDDAVREIDWHAAWIAASLLTALAIAYMPSVGLLEGRFVVEVNTMRLAQAILGSVVVWTTIRFGGGVWAITASAAVRVLCELALVRWRFGSTLRDLRNESVPEDGFGWESTVLPLQWRIAVQSLVNYFATQTFELILYKADSPTAAGRFGMTWNILMAIQATSLAWLQARLPAIGTAIADGRIPEARRTLRQTITLTIAFQVLGSAVLLVLLSALQHAAPRYAARMLPLLPTAIFCVSLGVQNVVICWASYVRLFRIEPFLRINLLWTSLIAVAAVVLGTRFGALGIAAGHAAVLIVVVPVLLVPVVRRERAIVEPAAERTGAADERMGERHGVEANQD